MNQLNLFPKAGDQPRYFALLELHEEKAYTAEELLEELEMYVNQVDLKQKVPCVPTYLIPGSNFFFMDVTEALTLDEI
jgi:hypothetical protein